jgi:hypothetical protein
VGGRAPAAGLGPRRKQPSARGHHRVLADDEKRVAADEAEDNRDPQGVAHFLEATRRSTSTAVSSGTEAVPLLFPVGEMLAEPSGTNRR